MKIKVKDANIEEMKQYVNERIERTDRGESTTMCELGQIHELNVLKEKLEKM